MPDDPESPDPARLPGDAPAALRRFVACETDSVELDLANIGWLPTPGGAPDFLTPSASIDDGWTPQSATITIGYGEFLSMAVPATIVDGKLHVDASNLAFGIGDEVTKWVDAFNATLAAHDKQLDRLDVKDGKLVLTKRPVAAATGETTVPAVGAAAVGASTGGETSTGGAGAGGASKPPGGCFAWIAGAIAAIALAVGIGIAVTSSGGDDTADPATDPVVVTDAPVETEAPPATEPPATDPPPTDPAATDPPTTDQVGAVPQDDPSGQLFCADFDALSEGGFDGDLDGYLLIGDNCEPVDGAYLPRNCDSGRVPCAAGHDPTFVATGTSPGFEHVASQPDVITGTVGPTRATLPFFMRSWDPTATGTALFSSDCGGDLLSGTGILGEGGLVTAEHPLMVFGPCQVIDIAVITSIETDEDGLVIIPVESLGDDGFYEVGPDELPPGTFDPDPYPQIIGTESVAPGWSDSVQTIGNVLGGTATLGDGCSAMVEPHAVTGSTVGFTDGRSPPCADRFWVFAAAQQSVDITLDVRDTVVGHNATFINPLAQVRPALADTIEFNTSGPLFDDGDPARDPIFPCGPGHLALGVCSPNVVPVDAGALVSVGVATGGPIPLDWDGTPRSYTIEFDQVTATALLEEAGWTMNTTDDRVRALLRDDSITFVLPQEVVDPGPDIEAISYVLRSMVDDVVLTQPPVPVVGLITAPVVLPQLVEPESEDDGVAAPSETLEEFYDQLSASIASGDLGFSLDRLDPIVYEAYPTECPAALERFADPEFIVRFVSDDGPAPWIWELPDGRTFDVPDAISITVNVGGRGQSGNEAPTHVRLDEGEYSWFTICDQ